MTIERLHVGQRLSQVVIHGNLVYTAGIVADDPNADTGGQTGQILDKIDRFLNEAGSNKSRILTATIWLADIKFYDDMNAVWDQWVPKGGAPARACVEARLARPEYRVEIRVVAAR